VKLKSVDLTVSLESLSFYLARNDEAGEPRRGGGAAAPPAGADDGEARTPAGLGPRDK
jgi:hypothetical protein